MSISESEQFNVLDQLAEEFAERFRRGERPTLAEYIDRYPELADDIRELFPAMVKVEQAERVLQAEEENQLGDSHAALRPLREIGDYRIIREIGRGGMGVVYEAEQISLGRRVALKVLPRQISGDRMLRERFRREARAAAKLHHTNIVPVYEVGQDGDDRFYAMQFIQGQGLDAVIAELRRLRDRSAPERKPMRASEGRSSRPRGEHSRLAGDAPLPGGEREVSAVLRSILDGRFDPGGGRPDRAEASQSMLVKAVAGNFTTQPGTGIERSAAIADPALAQTESAETSSGRASGALGAGGEGADGTRSVPAASSSSAILPGGTQLSSVESGRHAFFRSLAHIGRQVAAGLAYAHARGIVHRDIKPSNLLLDTEGVVWITDFGLAKGDDEGLTLSGDILGTIRYMAPERFRGEGDARADVYALGLSLYELITLRSGFASADRLALIEQIKTEEPQRPRAIDARIPRDLETIVLKAIEKDPKSRYRSAEAMGEDLRRFVADEPIVARPVSFWERGLKWARRRPALAASFVVVSLLLAGMLGLGVWSDLQIRQALQTAQRERGHAELERTAALAAAREEAAAHKDAQAANAKLGNAREELRHTLYATQSNLALAAWDANDLGRLQFQLELMQPGEDDPDLRGWEWHYLNGLAHEERLTFREHDREVDRVDFSPDGQTMASIQWGGRIKLWDPATGRVRLTLDPPQPKTEGPREKGVSGLDWSPDGARLAGPGPNATLGIWNTHTGALIVSFNVSSTGTQTVAFSPDGKSIATGSESRKVRIWDAASGKLLRDFENAHDHHVQRVVFSPDGKRLASAAEGAIKLWDVETGNLRAVIPCPLVQTFGLVFSPDGHTLVSGGSDELVRMWDVETGRERGQLSGHTSIVTALALRDDGRRLASAGTDAVVRLWDMSTGRQVRSFKGHTDRICWLAFSPDGNTLASCGFDKTVKLWDASRPPQPLVLTGPRRSNYQGAPRCVAFSPDGKELVSGHVDRAVRVWEAVTGRLRLTLTGHENTVVAVAFSPSGDTIASAGEDRTVRLWDAVTGLVRFHLAQHKGPVNSVKFSPDGRRLVSASDDGTLKIWDPATGQCIRSISSQATGVYRAEYSPDGRLVAALQSDGRVELWDAETGRHVSNVGDHRASARNFTFSPGGQSIAIGYKDKQIMIWDTATGGLLRSLKGHTAEVRSVAFSPDGRRLASGAHDQTVRLWDPSSGQDLLTLKGHSSWVKSVVFSRDGRRIASAADDGSIIVWGTAPAAPQPPATEGH